MKTLELLSPAKNKAIAIEAIKHGADAIYMGAPMFGARKNAGNSLDDLAEVIDFAHNFRSRVYITLNTIIYDNEIRLFENLCNDLYRIGSDAIIIQDMGILRMKLPPISLHASTQCDIRTPEKAKFLEEVGFSQIVLARELTLDEIKRITESVNIPVECFIHGALCVSYSGHCYASYVKTNRSANRGECSQLCRLPYILKDKNGRIIGEKAHYLSLKDLNQTQNINELVKIGVTSFKIEGRLKDIDYVKNLTAHYNKKLNDIIEEQKNNYKRQSYGKVETIFNPLPEKSFNRQFTDYFLKNGKNNHVSNHLTPKSMGEYIKDKSELNNGDGISFFRNGEYQGDNVIKIENNKIISAKGLKFSNDIPIYRTNDVQWQKMLRKITSERKIALDIKIDKSGISAEDERGMNIRIPLNINLEKSLKLQDYKKEFSKLGNTIYYLRNFNDELKGQFFIPNSLLSGFRRKIIEILDSANTCTYQYKYRRKENIEYSYPLKEIDYQDNVSNCLAESFYKDHGVINVAKALEKSEKKLSKDIVVMTTRYCILRELGLCGKQLNHPLELSNGRINFRLNFNCEKCEMEVLNM